MSGVGRLKRRAEFLRVAGAGRKSVTPGLILQVAPHIENAALPEGCTLRVGFTASRKVGIAVARNRARRRLRAAVDQVMALHALPGRDYVLIARAGTATRPFAALVGDLRAALRQAGAYHEAPAAAGER